MKWNLCYTLLALSSVLVVSWAEIPGCDYFDTVDLTNSEKLDNGNYKYQGVIIPKHKTGKYEYQLLYDGVEKPVAEHLRGCACQLKPCVRFCCDPQSVKSADGLQCIKKAVDYAELNVFVTHNNGTTKAVNPLDHFIVQKYFGRSCEVKPYYMEQNSTYTWQLFENGMLYMNEIGFNYGKEKYCIQPLDLGAGQYRIIPFLCDAPEDNTRMYVTIASIVCLILTIAVYLKLPNFNNRHHTFSFFYLCCFLLSFSCKTFQDVLQQKLPEWMCRAVAYIAFYFVMSMFLWLLVINYNFWTLSTSNGIKNVRLKRSHIFVWLSAGVLLLITALVDILTQEVDDNSMAFVWWTPGFAVYNCWIKSNDWSALIYYYCPIVILLAINSIFLIKSFCFIYMQSEENRKLWRESNVNIKNLANFRLFLRLFIVAGLLWTIEVYSYLKNTDSWLDNIASAQGIIIFATTILNREVLKDLWNRFSKRNNNFNQ